MNKKVDGITLGCRLNFYETEVLKSCFRNSSREQDVIIVNTCSVTHEAERQSKQAVRKCLKENPNARVIVTGCAVETSKDYFSQLPVEVMRNEKKTSMLREFDDKTFADRARAFVQIQNGCDHYCSYCIIPFTRGHSVSVPLEVIERNIKNFVNSGFKEIVLSGIDITSYGREIGKGLANVLEHIFKRIPELTRIRISSLDPAAIDDKLLHIICHDYRILPHIHLSIQSGDNNILKMMRRRHLREDVIALCNKIRNFRSDIVFGADFIVGFPGETEEMFKNTVALVDDAGLSMLHVFPFSPRAGTRAAQFVQLPHNIVHARAKELRNVANTALESTLNKFIGKSVNFIVEHDECGKTDHFLHAKFNDKTLEVGNVYHGKVHDIIDNVLILNVEQ